MEKFEVTILGCGSATPTLRHNPSAQVVNMRDKLSLVDCGEGTQLQLRKSGLKFMQIRNVFISHLHGDHCLGLVGLISTFGLLGRTRNFHIYAPKDLEILLQQQLELYCHNLEFEIVFHPLDTERHQIIYEDRTMEVWSLPLEHKMPCSGFLFREKPGLRHINRAMTDFYEIPLCYLNNIKAGMDWTTADGKVIPNEKLTMPADKVRSYAYCSDTMFSERLIEMVREIDLLYHEATYDQSKAPKAKARAHSTAVEAATVASRANVRQLMIGHFSASYQSSDLLLEQAREVFPNTIAADEGLVVKI